ncbi:hypothetical protein [Pseudomonas phage PS-1]|uniref:hypothetical protein n=1 Tax=Pseudomonas phage PS-1 TaxID=1573458 RepID=UPI00065C24C3|nr:hypothetical protein AXI79_gp21 [Pseudomonas phage PS-1]BAR92359.1 hypothetical protein [Pseudomonas phage PS-1]
MSNQGFTPGPWTYSRWDQRGTTSFYIAQADGAPYTPNYSDVATLISDTCSGEMVSIQEANARLIAAAPDLLEALECLLEMGHAKAGDLARAAIAKARSTPC